MRLTLSHTLPLALAALCAAEGARASTYLVLPVDGPGLLPSVRDGVELAVRSSLAGRTGDKVQARDETSALLADAAAGGLSCSLDSALCAARIGAIGGVDHVVITSLRELGAVVSMTLVDTATQRAVRIAFGPAAPTARDGGASVKAVVGRLLQPPSTLDLDVIPPDASVMVDGILVGRAPLDAPLALPAAPHNVRVTAPAHRDVVKAVDTSGAAAASAPTKVTIALERDAIAREAPLSDLRNQRRERPHLDDVRDAPPSGPQPLFVAGVATAGAGGLVALGSIIGVALVEAQMSTPRPGRDDPAEKDAAQSLGRALLVATGVGVVAAGVGGALIATAPSSAPDERDDEGAQ
jgi:hypothetical protein